MEKEEGAAFVGHSVDFSGAFLNQRNYQLERKLNLKKLFFDRALKIFTGK